MTKSRILIGGAVLAAVAVAVVAVVLVAKPFSSSSSSIDPTKPHVTDAVLARGRTENFVAVDPGFTFPADIQNIFAIVVVDNVFDPTTVLGQWSYLGVTGKASPSKKAEKAIDITPIENKTRNVALQLSDKNFDVGVYRLDVFVNGQKQKTLEFTVVPAGSGSVPPASSSTAPANPVPTAVPVVAQPTAPVVASSPVPQATNAPPAATPAPAAPPVPPTPPPAASTGGTYVVKSGDTLASIAQSMGVTLQALLDTNNITNPDLVNAGVALVVPPGGHLP